LEVAALAVACWLTPCSAQNNKVRWSKDYVYANGQILATVLPAGGSNAPQTAPVEGADAVPVVPAEAPATEGAGTPSRLDAESGAARPAPALPGRNAPAVRSTSNLYSRYADLVPGYRVTIHAVALRGSTVTITGRGFTGASVLRFANLARGELKELGLWRTGGTAPKIPLVVKGSREASFDLPPEAGPGTVCLQVLNPPYSERFTSPLYVLQIEQ
jgi:hypothetical protein